MSGWHSQSVRGGPGRPGEPTDGRVDPAGGSTAAGAVRPHTLEQGRSDGAWPCACWTSSGPHDPGAAGCGGTLSPLVSGGGRLDAAIILC